MSHIQPTQAVQKPNNELYDLDGSTLYNKQTGNTEGDITEMSFGEILEKVLRRKSDENIQDMGSNQDAC